MQQRLLVISCQQLLRPALVHFLSTLPDVRVVDQCAEVGDAAGMVESLRPDTVVLDNTGLGNPTQLTAAIAHASPSSRLIEIGSSDPAYRSAALQAGALAYIADDAIDRELPPLLARSPARERSAPR
jgi:DNA-binding NarL/FixJ family response regulator